MSGLLHDESRVDGQKKLGFQAGAFDDEKQPLDRPDPKYCPRFLSHSIEGPTFPDFACGIPEIVNAPSDLPQTVFAFRTIEKATKFRHWLVSELQQVLPWNNDRNRNAAEKLVLLLGDERV